MKKCFFIVPLLFCSNKTFANGLKRAIKLYDDREFLLAKDEIEKEKENNNPKFWYYRGVIFHKMLKNDILSDNAQTYLQEAVKSYNEVINLKNKTLSSYAKYNLNELFNYLMRRGNESIRIEDYNGALKSFQNANSVIKNDTTALKNMALSYQKIGNNNKALDLYDTILKNNNDDILILCDKAKILFITNKSKQAYDLTKELINKHPYNVICLETLYLSIKTKDITIQDKILEDVLSKDDDIRDYQDAVIAKFRKNYQLSFQLFENLHKDFPKNDPIFIQLCDVGYEYSQELIKQSNDDIENDDKYNITKDVLEKTVVYTENLLKKYNNNVNILEHLYNLYKQDNQEEKNICIIDTLKKLGCSYVFEN